MFIYFINKCFLKHIYIIINCVFQCSTVFVYRTIVVGAERFYCPEVLFEPRIMQRDNPPLTELIWQAIQVEKTLLLIQFIFIPIYS